jgi:5-methylcytosine-specific restriction endonuclease McrA
MMNKQTDFEILNRLHACVQAERKITLQVIELLKEVDQRKIYLTLGFGSLIEFCIQELKYSESAAWRRISAMRAVRDLPELEEKIETGKLSLAVISQAQTHIRYQEKKNHEMVPKSEKRDLFQSLEGLSSRETEKVLISRDPEVVINHEKLRQVTKELQELKLILTPEMQQDLEKLKALISHIMPEASLADVIQFALKDSLKKRNPEIDKIVLKQGSSGPRQIPAQAREKNLLRLRSMKQPRSAEHAPAPVLQGRNAVETSGVKEIGGRIQIPISVKRLVWKKSLGQCCYQHHGKRCASRFQLQIDHIRPMARGGSNALENLQLLCRQHNQQKGFA